VCSGLNRKKRRDPNRTSRIDERRSGRGEMEMENENENELLGTKGGEDTGECKETTRRWSKKRTSV